MSRVTAAAVDVLGTRRLISVLAAVSVLAGLAHGWRLAARQSHIAALVVPVGFALAFAAVLAAMVVATNRLDRLDIGVLGLAAVLFVVEHVAVIGGGYRGRTDESRLGRGALALLQRGIDPYSAAIPEHKGTHLLTGGIVTHYSYPPLTLEVGWVLSHIAGRLGEPWTVAELALLGTGIVVFAALPRSQRALAVPVVFGLAFLDNYVAAGFPAVVALPVLCVAAWRWTAIGATGRLGRWGVLQAAAVGLAAATQQLAWFVAALLVVALWVVRRGTLPTAAATAVVLRFVAVTLAAFVAVNLPFVVWDAGSWWSGVTAVFRQEAVPFGGGLVLISVAVIGHCANFAFFSWATGLLAVAAVVVTAVGIRRVGPAVPVLASALFLLSARSDVEYFVAFVPVWFVWLATSDRVALAAARPVSLPGRGPVLTTPARKTAAVVAAVLPAAVLAAVAVTAAATLRLHVRSVASVGSRPAFLVVTVTNRTSRWLAPTFSVGARGYSHSWDAVGGPLQLPPGGTRTVRLAPVGRRSRVAQGWRLSAFTAQPASLSSAAVPLRTRATGRP
jgi:hypothetical protein